MEDDFKKDECLLDAEHLVQAIKIAFDEINPAEEAVGPKGVLILKRNTHKKSSTVNDACVYVIEKESGKTLIIAEWDNLSDDGYLHVEVEENAMKNYLNKW